jgi:hypothetical protein
MNIDKFDIFNEEPDEYYDDEIDMTFIKNNNKWLIIGSNKGKFSSKFLNYINNKYKPKDRYEKLIYIGFELGIRSEKLNNYFNDK